MANNKIQIKRSIATAITNTTPSVSNGELVFTSNGYILAIGDPANSANVIAIGGARYPGVLTANQALVANTTSGIDKIITANLTLSGASVNAINAVANLTHLGTPSNNELTTTWAVKTFVDAKIAQASNPQGTNGQFQYNDSGILAGTNNMVFDKTTSQITVGNSTINVQIGYTGSINSMAHFHGNQNSYVQVVMQNVNNGTRSSSDFVAENDLGDETQNFVDLGINSSTYNDPAYSAMGAGDSYLYAANNNLSIGTASAGDIKFFTGGTTSGQIRVEIDAGGNVGIGNTAPNAKLQVTGTANISGLTTFSSNVVYSTTSAIVANGTVGTAGQVLTSNATTVYWATPATGVSGSDTQIQYNDGGNLAGAAGLTFIKASNNVNVANTINAVSHNSGVTGTGTGGTVQNTTTMFLGNNTINTVITSAGLSVNGATIANNTGVYTGIVNATSHNSGALGTGTGGFSANATTILVGNNTLNTSITASGLVVNGTAVIANNSGVYTTGTVNAATVSVGTSVVANSTRLALGTAVGLQVNGSIGTAGQILYSNGTTGYWAAAPAGTITGVTAANGLVGGGASGTVQLDVGAGNGISVSADAVAVLANGSSGLIANATGLHVKTGAGIIFDGSGNVAVNTAALSFQDLTVSGNLTVLGDLVSLNVATLSVEDPIITLAKDQSASVTYTDAVDIGFFGTYGNTANAWVSGLFRDQSDSGLWKLFSSNGTYTNTIIDTANTNAFKLATLQAFLTSGAITTNSTSANIIANSTYTVGIVANSLTLSTALAGTSGGTGKSTVTNNALLVGNATNGYNELTLGTSGYVLQSNGTAIVYDTLDGGTF